MAMPSKRGARVVPHPAAGADSLSDKALCVDIAQIECYEHNPRQSRNPEYDRIRASILMAGLDQPLLITRRPGETHFIVYGGGNTRLRILKDLYASTSDERFYRVQCHYVEWQQESTVLLAHLRENDLRGDLTFIDKAHAVLQFRDLITAERRSRELSHRQLATVLKDQGYPVSYITLAVMEYAVSALLPAMPEALGAGLGRRQVERIRGLHRAGEVIWEIRALGQPLEFHQTFHGLCQRYDGPDWQFESLRQALETELAEAADIDIQVMRMEFECRLAGRAPEVPQFLQLDDLTDDAHAVLSETVPAEVFAGGRSEDACAEKLGPYGRPEVQQTGSDKQIQRAPDGCVQVVVELPRNGKNSDVVSEDDSGQVPAAVERLRRQAFSLAHRLGARHGFADLIVPLTNRGSGFVVCNAPGPLHAVRLTDADNTVRSNLWWGLVAVAEMSSAPIDVVSEHLYPDSALRAAITSGDWSGVAQSVSMLQPVHEARQFWAALNEADWQDWWSLLNCYRTLRRETEVRDRSLWERHPC